MPGVGVRGGRGTIPRHIPTITRVTHTATVPTSRTTRVITLPMPPVITPGLPTTTPALLTITRVILTTRRITARAITTDLPITVLVTTILDGFERSNQQARESR